MDRKKIEVKMIPTKWLAYFDRNINVLSGKKREDLMKSIEEEGIKEPLVVVEKENTKLGTKFIVLDGNHRLTIAKSLKMLEVPCIIKDIPEDRFFHEHILLNYYRGEVSLQRLCGHIKSEIDKGTPIKELAKQMGMSESWLLSHYEMAMIEFNEDEFEKSLKQDNLITVPIVLKCKVVDTIFNVILNKDKEMIGRFIGGNIRRHRGVIKRMEKQIQSLIDSKHGNTDWTKIMEIDGQAKFIKGKIDHRKSLLIKDNRLLKDLQDNPNKEQVRKLIMEGLILSDFSGLLGDLLDNVTEEMVKKLVGVE